MFKKLISVVVLASSMTGAYAQVVDFETVTGAKGNNNNPELLLPGGAGAGYDGFTWAESVAGSLQLYDETRASAKIGGTTATTGLGVYMAAAGVTPLPAETSGNWVAAINNSASSISFSSASAFDFDSAFFYGSKASEVITVTGFLNGATVGSWTSDTLLAGTALSQSFGSTFGDVDKITISSLKGSMAFDNLVIDPVAAVPEPSTYAMLLAGIGMIGLIARRRSI